MRYEMLITILRELPPTGRGSFESLVGALMAAVFEMRAVPAGGGYQAGRDISLFELDTGKPAGIDIEVKRYAEGNLPPESDLLGKIVQTRLRRPDVHLWILVSTAPFPADKVRSITQQAEKEAFELKLIDSGFDGIGWLEVMVASHDETTLAWVRESLQSDVAKWQAAIASIQSHPAYEIQRRGFEDYVKSRFAPAAARKAAQEWLTRNLNGSATRVRGLNQTIGRSDKAPAIARPRINKVWRSWLKAEPRQPQLLTMLGDEGDGKTWCALNLLIEAKDRTPLVATSNMFDDGGAESLIARALANQCGGDEDRWRDRLINRSSGTIDDLRILLLIDGVNEAPRKPIREVLMEILTRSWPYSIDLVVTCRTPFWRERVAPYVTKYSELITLLEIGKFEPSSEWPRALKLLGPDAKKLPFRVTESLRNPRLWSFAFQLRDQLGGLQELTLERLLIEHWRMRIEERSELDLTPQRFSRLVAKVAADVDAQLRPCRLFEHGDIEALLGHMGVSSENFGTIIGEISDGLFLTTTGQDKLKLRPERVLLALGFLLAQQIVDVIDLGADSAAIRRTIGAFLHDLPAKDEVELIIRSAIFVLLSSMQYRSEGLPPLLRHWVALQNFENDAYRALAIVVRASPDTVAQAIEDDAGDDELIGEAAAELAVAMIGRCDQAAVRQAMTIAAARWLGMISNERAALLGTGSGDGVIVSPLAYHEMLYDYAASFLVNLPVGDWIAPLTAWLERRSAVESMAGCGRDFDDHLQWLGMSGQMDDATVSAVQMKVAGPNIVANERCFLRLGELLNGMDFYNAKARAASNQSNHTVDSSVAESGYDGLYGKLTPGGATWADAEFAMLEDDPSAMLPFTRKLAEELRNSLARGETPGGIAQFVTNNALLLGEEAVEIVRHYLQNCKPNGVKEQAPFPPGNASPAIFVAIDSRRHASLLFEFAELANCQLCDLTGFAPMLDERSEQLAAAGIKEGGNARAAALQMLDHWPADHHLPKNTVGALIDIVLGAVGTDQATAVRILKRQHSLIGARAVASSGLASHDIAGLAGPDDVSQLIVEGTENPNYEELRHRVSVGSLAIAAIADGSAKAQIAFARDFAALLAEISGDDSLSWDASVDFTCMPTTRAQHRESSSNFEAAKDPLSLNSNQIDAGLNLVEKVVPTALKDLWVWLGKLSFEQFEQMEIKTGLVSSLAKRSPPETARDLMIRLAASNAVTSEIVGYSVQSPYAFAFASGQTEHQLLRNSLADRAWNDSELLDLVSAALIGGWDAWLDEWIRAEAASCARSCRVRSIVLRGWRASPEDEFVLNDKQATGYERLAAETAGDRLRNMRTMEQLAVEYRDSSEDTSAWLILRRLLHCADRRLVLVSQRAGWLASLSPSRSAYFELMRSEHEWFFRRNEGDLKHSFAGVRVPASTPPWTPITVYGGN